MCMREPHSGDGQLDGLTPLAAENGNLSHNICDKSHRKPVPMLTSQSHLGCTAVPRYCILQRQGLKET
jgi:hypothetical protein